MTFLSDVGSTVTLGGLVINVFTSDGRAIENVNPPSREKS